MIKSNKKRIGWVDTAKGITMFFVLLIHFDRRHTGRISALALMFCVQMFFFLSGMFSNPDRYSLPQYIKRQAKSLLMPYGIFSAVNLGFHLVYNPHIGMDGIVEITVNMLLARRNSMLVAAMWFLPCLFLVSIIYKLLTMAVKNKKLLVFICLVASAFAKVHLQEPMLPFTANQCLRFLIYYCGGDLLCPYIKNLSLEDFFKQSAKTKTAIIIYMAVGFVLSYILYKKEYIIYFYNDFLFYSSLFINTVMLISLVVLVSIALEWCLPLREIGKNTLGLCCLENINRTLVNTAMGITGIGFLPDKPLKVLVFNGLAICIGYVILTFINRFLPFMLGKTKS